MNFYYDPQSQASIDRNSGVFIRPTGQFTSGGWARYIYADPHSRERRETGIGLFEFTARPITHVVVDNLDDGRKSRRHVYDGYEIAQPSIEEAFANYSCTRGSGPSIVREILTAAFLAELKCLTPSQEFEIRFVEIES